MLNSTQLLVLGLLVWFAMSNKSKETRNVLLVVAGLLFFCMMNVKEGFAIDSETTRDAGSDPETVSITAASPGGTASDQSNHVFTILTADAAAAVAHNGQPVGAVVTCKIGTVEAEAKWATEVEGSEWVTGENPTAVSTSNIHNLFVCEECLPGQTLTNGVCTADVQDVDCVGSWSTCEADCADKTYTVSVPKVGETSRACSAAPGDTAACSPGDGACPPAAAKTSCAQIECGDPAKPQNIYGTWKSLDAFTDETCCAKDPCSTGENCKDAGLRPWALISGCPGWQSCQ